jgi:hypothetical protein
MTEMTFDRWREHSRANEEAWVQINKFRAEAQQATIRAARANLIVEAITAKATEWAALASEGDRNDNVPAMIYGDVGEELLGIIEHPVPRDAPFTEPEVPDDEI